MNFPDGREIGPVTRAQLMAAMQGGKVSADCQVFRSDWQAWRPATDVATKLGVSLAAPSLATASTNSLWDQVASTDFKPPPPPPPPARHGPSIIDQYMPKQEPVSDKELREKVMTLVYCVVPYFVMLMACSIFGGPIGAMLAIMPAFFIIMSGVIGVAICVFRWPWLVDGPLCYIQCAILGKELFLTLSMFQSVCLLILGYAWTGFILFGTIMAFSAKMSASEDSPPASVENALESAKAQTENLEAALEEREKVEQSFQTTDFSGPWGKAFAPYANPDMAVKHQDFRIKNMRTNVAKIQQAGKMNDFMPALNLQLQQAEERRAFLATFLQYGDKPPAKSVIQTEFDRLNAQWTAVDERTRNQPDGTFMEKRLRDAERNFRRQMAFEAGTMLQNWPVP